jgi:hypothetical protein
LMTREKLEGLQMETSLIFIHHPESWTTKTRRFGNCIRNKG